MVGLLPYIDHILRFVGPPSPDKGVGRGEGAKLVFWSSLILGVASYILIIAGLTIHLMSEFSLPLALCTVGLITLATMLFLVATYRVCLHLRRKKIQKTFKDITDEISGVSEEFLNKFDNGVKDNAVLLALIAAITGYVVSRKIF